MRTDLRWNHYDDNESIDGNCKCKLGINRKTGRLQWCPGCSCCKLLIVLPVIMIPVIVSFFLLIRFDGIAGAPASHPSTDAFYGLDDAEYDNNVNQFNDRETRCTAVRFGLSETIDIEENDLLKDTRTSFIPPEVVVIPPNCVSGSDETPSSVKVQRSLTEEEAFYLDFLTRHRRSFLDGNETDQEVSTSEIQQMVNGQNEETHDPWKTDNSESESDDDHAKLEEDEEPQGVYADLMAPVGFHSFWKGEGTRENIRLTQAEIMKQYIDPKADPCTDFYQYSCGNWPKLNPIPKDKAGYDTFEMLRESLDEVLRDLLVEKDSHEIRPVDNRLDQPSESSTTAEYHSTTQRVLRFPIDIKNTLDAVKLRKFIQKREIISKILRRYQISRIISRRRREINSKRKVEEIDAELKAKYLYASCMNSELLDKRGIEPLLKLLQDLGGWPVLEPDWSEDKFDWLNLTAQLRLFNNDILLVIWVGPDIKNSDENIIQLDQTSLGLPTRDYFLHDSNIQYLDAYRDFMTTIMNLLGSPLENAIEVASEVIEFEGELAKITSSSEERANVSILYKRMSLESLNQQVSGIDWARYVSQVQQRPVDMSEMVVIYATDYMQNLVTLIGKTEPRTVANYLLWRFVRHRVNNLDDRFKEAKQKFFHVLFGREQSPPRWKNCVGQVNSNMGMALGAMFVRKYFDENSKRDTLRMTHELQQAFREILNNTDWLDMPTKHLSELKVNSMSLKIGYPDFILSREELNKKYEGLHIDPERYFENTINILRHVTKTEQQKLNEPVNKTIWQTAPAIVNAYYSRNKNQIMFPAGILQPPFYHRHFPRALNYGGIGVVIGHELTHGFDDKGRLFDRDGNIHKWWSDHAINGFHERARCLISQYGNYTVSEVGIAVDGESTQGENIADNGGIRQAFYAYKNWLERSTMEGNEVNESLPGLNMTGTQLFFLNFAQVWCGAMRPEATRNKLKTAVHSPGKFRVIGTLSNSVEFAREFRCPLGSPMNPAQKCSVW